MRNDNAAHHTTGSLPETETVQPDPMMDEQPAGPGRIIAVLAGAAVVVALVFYGLTRTPEPQQTATAPSEAQTAPAGGGAANNTGGQAQPANALAQPSQANPQQPATTGQGTGSHTPPAAGGSATSAVGPGAKPAPEAR
jgi:hypothetical protein